MSRTWVILVPPIGALITVIGCLGTWRIADDGLFRETAGGLRFDDGVIFLVGAIVLGLAGLVANRRWMNIVVGSIAGLGAIAMAFDISSLAEGAFFSVGWGAIVTEIGLVVLAVGAIYRAITMPPPAPKPKTFFEAPEAVVVEPPSVTGGPAS